MAIYPLAIGAVAIIASIIGALSVRTRTGNVEAALYRGLAVSAVLSAAAFYPITKWLMDDPLGGGALGNTSVTDLWLCGLIGVGVTAALFVLTDFYTSTRFRPVRTIAEASETGHATNIIQGLAQGFQSTALPVLVLALAILGAWKLAGGGTDGIYGIGVAVMAQLSLTGLIVALDAFGPITDNAGGIAEMADLPEEVRNITDPLDAVGNTTKAVTKGYAIGSAALAALVLFNAFTHELQAEAGDKALSFSDLRSAGADRAADRRDDGLPVLGALDRGGGPRRRRAWSRRCAASSGSTRGSCRAPRSPSTGGRSASSPPPPRGR